MRTVLQLEEAELGPERIGMGPSRACILLWEAGGRRCLARFRRFVEEADIVARVAREALLRCHFDDQGNDLKPDCLAACYAVSDELQQSVRICQLDRRHVLQILRDLQ